MKGMNSRMVCYFSVLIVHLELVDLNEIAERLSAVKKADSSTLIRNLNSNCSTMKRIDYPTIS